jgi:hypothetical protein
MDAALISPKYLMNLAVEIDKVIWDQFASNKYRSVKFYIERWHEYDERNDWENFRIFCKDNGDIRLPETLNNVPPEILLKMAVDLGLQTPDYIPAIVSFKNDIKTTNSNSALIFEKAFKDVEDHPDLAIGLANTTLEGIIKDILKDNRIEIDYSEKKTLYDLTQDILKAFELYPNSNLPLEVRHIGSGLLKVNQSIEKLRSEQTAMHGKADGDLVITDPLYAYFIINTVTTVGLFLRSYYKLKFPPASDEEYGDEDDLPF